MWITALVAYFANSAVFPHLIPSLLTHTIHSVVLGPYQACGQFARCIGKPGALSL